MLSFLELTRPHGHGDTAALTRSLLIIKTSSSINLQKFNFFASIFCKLKKVLRYCRYVIKCCPCAIWLLCWQSWC